ncbi:hypothetical protein [Salinibacillus xinjiangensis]|uniref:Uncharacterized protein n=1 Tax=Salinibacillus xinjiangensis TaxID=1229268 RepID=A0A6G1XA71_9BACI|nr:hypothetical protein [Salinibacillus xinjiangensis]MRG87903.1 hypothetical protein [Salinibacillus xinjiangensis]
MCVLHDNKEGMSQKARRQLSYEIIEYKQLLKGLKIKLNDLTSSCPKNADTRQNAIKVAKLISENTFLSNYIKEMKKPPLKELKKLPIVHHKTIKKHRKYIIAISIIYIMEFTYIKKYMNH